MYTTIELDKGRITTIWLNRPDVMNAFNGDMVEELIQVFDEIAKDDKIKVVVIRGKGNVLTWMKRAKELSYNDNFSESLNLAKCFSSLYYLPQPVISVVHGAVMGGGNGLVAAADISVCTNTTIFAFSEVKLGVVPAVISPYVLQRIGYVKAKELMLTGKKFTGQQAEIFNLVNLSVEESSLEDSLQNILKLLASNSAGAMQKIKELIIQLQNLSDIEEIKRYTAKVIAHVRVSSDGQEGMSAFLEKRKPNWI